MRFLTVAMLLTSLLPGCGSQCDRHPTEPPVVFEDGVTDHSAHVYMSGTNANDPWDGPFLHFPPGRTLRFVHRLGGEPRSIQFWFSFNPHPLTSSNGAGATSGTVPAAGNQATLQEVTPNHVDVRNDTCSEVYLFVRLAEPVFESTTDGGVSGDGGATP
jgi:hypothetical protein